MVLTKNEQALLLYLWKHVEEEYSINQLAKNVGISARGAFKILQKFEQQGMLVKRQVANAVIHSLDFSDHRTEDLIKYALKSEHPNDYVLKLKGELQVLKNVCPAAVLCGKVITAGARSTTVDLILIGSKEESSAAIQEFETRSGKKVVLHEEGELLEMLHQSYVLWGHELVYARVKEAEQPKSPAQPDSAVEQQMESSVTADEQIASSEDQIFGMRYLSLIENMKDLIFALDVSGRFTYLNRMSMQLLQYEPEALLGKNILDITSKSSQPLLRDYLSKTAISSSFTPALVITIDLELRTRDYELKTFSVGLSVQKQGGKIVGINGVARDITVERTLQHEKEEAQAAIRLYLESVLALVPSAVMVFDYAMYCTYANQKYFELFDEKEVTGKGLHMLLPVLLVQQYNLDMKARQVIQTKKSFTIPAVKYEDKYLRLSIVSVRNEEADSAVEAAQAAAARIAIVIIIDDITQLMGVEEAKRRHELQKQEIIKLREVDELKTGFLNVTSHELKTPLTPTLIQAQLMEEEGLGKLNEQQKISMEIIIRNMKQLEKLIDDVLDISRIQSRSLKLEPSEGRLDTLVSNVVESMKLKAGSRNISLLGKISPLPPIFFDDGRIRQVVRNLITNAIKFTLPGGIITVSAQKVKDYLQVDVMDNGHGISKENVKKIFQPFFQVKASYKIKEKGRGLGLSICKGIVQNHGGKIWLDSVLGKGTTFHFTLPLKMKVTGGTSPALSQAHLNNKNI